MNLQQRLLSAFFIVAIPILAIIFITSCIIIYAGDRERVHSEQRAALNSIGRQLEYITEDTKILSKDIIFDDDVQASLTSNEFDANTTGTAYFIRNFIANRNYINSVVLTKTDETVFSTERAFTDVSGFYQIQQKSWYPQLQALEDPYLWIVTEDGFLFARKIYDLRDYRTLLGYEMIYLSDTYINDIWASCDFGKTTNLFLMDAAGNILLSNAAVQNPDTNYVNQALVMVEECGRLLGKACAAISCVVDPETFVIGGGMSKAGEILISGIRKYFKEYAFHASRATDFCMAELGNLAGIYGGVCMLLED